MTLEHGEFMKELNEKHTDNAFYIVTSEVNGLTDISGRNDIISFKITYTETAETLAKRDFKQIKFWMYKADASGLGQFITESVG